ncbi:oligo-1,6-glucosidase/glucan 1,6-alpha-glucosidase [Clostridium beijerinckii]|uniref:Oligo-1,6-glucosidase/glucan 1,6-alpha-glucosidase n=1 Tax=Clostridium beijerinckii TaxID=1520 RepID=A0AAX0B2U2_CLOBE|nr:alpha-glucosidase [Clostridium beijerinckii]NRT33021.1 oligo-1,6-glucosidase/glucan 1,6-alpha-glucosidase [Clostridium beijerinckii]NRT47554.1 oligo-1,6-glucosidase/glucan 1,6-alpha-glucosidase [Clostridium beijerinckii]NRT89675.1 oligo-1,6-glucosidase/glucan 1,6-alpha-glucosidase [Clostridium beijerinckii]NRZ24156.1 oligo-1,6-glucosidase/glucan 1,6-alpha-glucosidase [Clostridium beijerinckii]NYC75133.1 oligo-1,6-glucosidase/glucan 1,6-alpha-glucosidase [Clostridium beijerinckii]
MTRKWWHDVVVYQIYPRSFMDSNGDGVGDLKGIISKLDYLKDLGIGAIWLSPINKSPNVDNGYDISDYYDIMDDFGTISDMRTLVDEMHSRNIKLIMDLVLNHTSDEHYWFKEAKKGRNNKYRDYYIWRDKPNEIESNFGGSAWEYDKYSNQYYFHLHDKRQPDLNWENPLLRKDIEKMINFWLDFGVDGFRFDVIDLIGKEVDNLITKNGPKLHEYLQELNRNTFGKRDVLTVGETWGATPEIAMLYSNPNRNELNMVFQFEVISLDKKEGGHKWDLAPLDFMKFKKSFSKWQTCLYGKGWNSIFGNNHDLPRMVSRWGNDKEYRVESAKMLATMLHMQMGTPYIYQGEEIGMTNVKFDSIDDYNDIECLTMYKERMQQGYNIEEIMNSIYVKGRDNARTPMQWSSGKNASFTEGIPWLKINENYKEINVEQALNDKDSIYYYYKDLINLRKKYDAIKYGEFKLILEENKEVFAYTRTYKNEQLLVICNFYEDTTEIIVPREFLGKDYSILISNYKEKTSLEEKIKLRPYESIVYKL